MHVIDCGHNAVAERPDELAALLASRWTGLRADGATVRAAVDGEDEWTR